MKRSTPTKMRFFVACCLSLAFMLIAAQPSLAGVSDNVRVGDPVGGLASGPKLGGSVPGQTLGNTSDSDFWRQVRERGVGDIDLSRPPNARDPRIIRGEYLDCVKNQNCTELAVGFSLPIHSHMPTISERQGKGPKTETVGFMVLILMGLALWCLVVFVRANRTDDSETKG